MDLKGLSFEENGDSRFGKMISVFFRKGMTVKYDVGILGHMDIQADRHHPPGSKAVTSKLLTTHSNNSMLLEAMQA